MVPVVCFLLCVFPVVCFPEMSMLKLSLVPEISPSENALEVGNSGLWSGELRSLEVLIFGHSDARGQACRLAMGEWTKKEVP